MKKIISSLCFILPAFVFSFSSLAASPPTHADSSTNAPFPYIWATAYHVLPETTSEESGYFSLCEGRDGSVYVGTAKYGHNAYLVEFDPVHFAQRIVIDAQKVCGLTNTGYAAQAKLHTRNYVGASGKIYVGSKQGYRQGTNDLSEYGGGFVITYDPRTGRGENLGMPYPKQGVIDIVADESRSLLYAVTCEDQHWMLGSTTNTAWKELGPMLTGYATTLVDAHGKAHALTKNFDLARYDPKTGAVTVRPVLLDKKPLKEATQTSVPTWNLAPDGKTAYLLFMNNATLFTIDLSGTGKNMKAVSCGLMTDGKGFDSRSSLSIAADGRVWILVRVDNSTGFGTGSLQQLIRYNPASKKMENLGVLAIKNPDFHKFEIPNSNYRKNGYHRFPDGTLSPLNAHMGLVVGHDNTIYVTILYPYSLLRIEGFRTPSPAAQTNSPTAQVLDKVLSLCDDAEKELDHAAQVGEMIADRHIKGGAIGAWWGNGCLGLELYGRSGNLINIGFERLWTTNRTEVQKANDTALIGMEWAPWDSSKKLIQAQADRKINIVGFGPKNNPEIAKEVAACTTFFDTGFGADDCAVKISDTLRAGHLNHVANSLYGWMVMAETTAALTRQGKMPAMWKSYSYPDGREWGNRYLFKKQFHDEFSIPKYPPKVLALDYINRIRYLIRRVKIEEIGNIQRAAELIAAESKQGRKTVVAWAGHMPEGYIERVGDSQWAQALQFHPFLEGQRNDFRAHAADGALVLRLGYHGIDPEAKALFKEKKNRFICLAGENLDPAWAMPKDSLVNINLFWAFGDACVTIEGFPFPVYAPSGILQAAAYSAICAEVAARLPEKK